MDTTPRTTTVAPVAARPHLDRFERGDPAGPAVVLLHGLSDSRRSYEPLVRHLPGCMRTVAITLRGHGDSDQPEDGYAPDDLAADVRDLLDDLGVQAAVVVGHSMGSIVAQRFAVDHPDRTAGLVLIGAIAPLQGEPLVDDAEAMFAGLADPVPESFIREFQASTLAVPVHPDFFEQVVAESRKVPARVWRAAWAGIRDSDLTPELPRITAPTMLAWGDRDQYGTRAMQERLLAAISTSQLRVYPGLGHSPHWEQPARLAVDLAAFVDQVTSAGRPS